MTSSTRRSMGFGAVATVLLLSGVAAGPVGAHPEGPAHHAPLPAHATAVMKAFARDAQPASTTASTGAAACDSGTGLAAGQWPCSNVDLEYYLPLDQMGDLGKANDVWGWTSGTRHFALVGRVYGTSFVEVTDPTNPDYLGYLPTHGAFGSSWRDIKVDGDHAFIVSEAMNHGMQVFDLKQLLTASGNPVKFGETAHYSKVSTAHNIAINEATDRAYIVGAAGRNSCKGGLHIVDISNPKKPTMVGCYSGDGYTHDTQCVAYTGPDTDYSGKGREICFSSNEDTLTIVDVTGRLQQLSRTGYAGSAYTHQGWLTEDQKYFLIDDEMDERTNGHGTRTWVFDVTDLNAPELISYFDSSAAAIDHNQYVVGGYSFQANYRSGLRILDARTPAAGLTQAGYFDIYPADDAPEFNGAWSVYPYFTDGSGRFVVVSGIEQGLFVLRPNLS